MPSIASSPGTGAASQQVDGLQEFAAASGSMVFELEIAGLTGQSDERCRCRSPGAAAMQTASGMTGLTLAGMMLDPAAGRRVISPSRPAVRNSSSQIVGDLHQYHRGGLEMTGGLDNRVEAAQAP